MTAPADRFVRKQSAVGQMPLERLAQHPDGRVAGVASIRSDRIGDRAVDRKAENGTLARSVTVNSTGRCA